jgi:hypothetical protein
VATFRYWIEPRCGAQINGDADIDDEDLEGLTGEARADTITAVLQDTVNEECPWGWEEIKDD